MPHCLDSNYRLISYLYEIIREYHCLKSSVVCSVLGFFILELISLGFTTPFKWNSWYLQVLCKSYPSEFISYFHYCRSLRFDDKPDYSYLKRLFRDLFIREGSVYFWLHILLFIVSVSPFSVLHCWHLMFYLEPIRLQLREVSLVNFTCTPCTLTMFNSHPLNFTIRYIHPLNREGWVKLFSRA